MNYSILEIINPEAHFPVSFSFPITSSDTIEDGINEFLKEVYQQELDLETIDDILYALKHNDVYWLDETYCFTLVPVSFK